MISPQTDKAYYIDLFNVLSTTFSSDIVYFSNEDHRGGN